MLEDGLGGGGAKDDGHDAPRTSAARAGEDVGLERPLEQFGPRRARLVEAEGTFTTAEWETLKSKYPKCPDCNRLWRHIPVLSGKKSAITRDHIVAISKGGRNDISNLRPLCYSCNSKKGDR